MEVNAQEVQQSPVAPQAPPEPPTFMSTKPKKGLKILITLIIFIGLGVGGFFVYKNIIGFKVEKEVVPAPSTKVRVYKGIWIPMLLAENTRKLDSDMKKLKSLGVNTVFFQGFSPQLECLERLQGRLPPAVLEKVKEILPIEKELMIANIQTAYRNGLRVGLTMGKCTFVKLEEIDLEAWNSKVVELAKLAEEHEVELFAPMNEPEVLFGPSASAEWGQEILPKIREVYHGKIVWKGGAVGDIHPDPGQPDQTNFSGYDYIGFTLGLASNAGMTMEDFSQQVDHSLDTIIGFAERDNVKGIMITEFYGLLPGTWEKNSWSEEKEARAHEIVLEKVKGKVVGFFALDFLGLSFFREELPGPPISEITSQTQEVLKRYFTEILD